MAQRKITKKDLEDVIELARLYNDLLLIRLKLGIGREKLINYMFLNGINNPFKAAKKLLKEEKWKSWGNTV